MFWRMKRGASRRARLGLAACLLTSAIPLAGATRAAETISCEPAGTARDRPVPMPRLKRILARGTEARFLDIGPVALRGLGDADPAATYPRRLQALLRRLFHHSNILVDAAGSPGQTMALALDRIRDETAGDTAAFVILRVGADDAHLRTPPSRFEASLRQGVDLLRAAGVDMEIVGLPQQADLAGDAAQTAVSRALATVARDKGAPYVDRATPARSFVVAEGGEAQMSDGGLTIDDFGFGCLPEQVARPIVEGVRATR